MKTVILASHVLIIVSGEFYEFAGSWKRLETKYILDREWSFKKVHLFLFYVHARLPACMYTHPVLAVPEEARNHLNPELQAVVRRPVGTRMPCRNGKRSSPPSLHSSPAP